VCTLGPASARADVLEQMIRAGMDCVRLNFSHGTHEDHKKLFEMVKALSVKYQHQIAIMCDIQGPKIRTGKMLEPFNLHAGQKIEVTPHKIVGTPEAIQVKYETMLIDLNTDDIIFINDGIIKLRVLSKTDSALQCICEAGGLISNHKGCNIPSGNISLNVITPKDAEDLRLIAELNPEYVASSFIGTGDDVRRVRQMLADYGNTETKIISKVERPIALENIDAIIEESDAIMVARGDLGVEIDTWDVPSAQKMMCRKANAAGKPVIVATQMLESMTSSSRPTRAEANDVFNAVLDGADAVMLSGETAVGKYPIEAITVMDNIVAAAEKSLQTRRPSEYNSKRVGLTETISLAIYHMTLNYDHLGWTGKCIVITGPPSGYVARMVSKFRPPIDIIAITEDIRTARELNLLWGVRSHFHEDLSTFDNIEDRNIAAIKRAMDLDLVGDDDHIMVASRSLKGKHTGSGVSFYTVTDLKKQGIL